MRIKILVSCAGNEFSFSSGQIVEANSDIANDLLNSGYAEEIETSTSVKPRAQTTAKQKAGVKADAAT